jgi:DNA replication protein DnaC
MTCPLCGSQTLHGRETREHDTDSTVVYHPCDGTGLMRTVIERAGPDGAIQKIPQAATACPYWVKATQDDLRAAAVAKDSAFWPIPRMFSDAYIANKPEGWTDRYADPYLTARRWADSWPHVGSLIIVGPHGCGKSHLAAAVAKFIRKPHNASVAFVPVNALVERLSGVRFANGETVEAVVGHLAAVDVLVLDDYGKQRITGPTSAQLFDLFDRRYSRRAPTIITTNPGAARVAGDDQDLRDAVMSRLRDDAVLIDLPAVNLRKPMTRAMAGAS